MLVIQLLLAAIALSAAWVAAQQMLIARQKLNHDLFDRRYAVYVATQHFMVACLNSINGNVGDVGPFIDAQRVAPFLFGKELSEYLAHVWRHSANIQVFGQYVSSPSVPEHQQMMKDYHTSQRWLLAELQGSAERFYPSLSLTNIKPFSMREILPGPVIEAVTARLSEKENGSDPA